MSNTETTTEPSLRQKGFMAADKMDELADHSAHPVDKELYRKIGDVMRRLAAAIPPEQPTLRLVK
jgi:hypothetical protein